MTGKLLPTARNTLRTGYARVLVFCNLCRHQADADLQAIVDSGRGNVPLTKLQFRCSLCGSGRTDFVVTSRDFGKVAALGCVLQKHSMRRIATLAASHASRGGIETISSRPVRRIVLRDG